jgi:hypothetical protein
MTTPVEANLITKLAELLDEIGLLAGDSFAGIGVIVSGLPESLPIIPLRSTSIPQHITNTVGTLARISNLQDEFHDGFHVLDSELNVRLVAQYFSPSIIPRARIDRSKRFGGRYLAALFGSALPGVLATGIASRDFGIAIFQNAEERLHRLARNQLPHR